MTNNLTPAQQEQLADLLASNPDKPTEASYEFSKPIQREIVGMLLQENSVLSENIEFVKPDYFIDLAHARIVRIILDYYGRYGAAPPLRHVENDIRERYGKANDLLYMLAELKTCHASYTPGVDCQEYLESKVRLFAKQQSLKWAMRDIINMRADPDVMTKAIDLLTNLQTKFTTTSTMPLFETYDDFVSSAADETDWIIPNWLERGMLMLFGGRAKGGKTKLLLNLITQLLSEQPVLGVTSTAVPVLYLDCECQRSYLKNTISAALGAADNAGVRDNLFVVSRSLPKGETDRPILPSYISTSWLQQAIAQLERRTSSKGIVVVDTLAGAFGGTPGLPDKWENDSGAIGKILRPLQDLCHSSGWSIIIVHHTGVNGKLRGSTELSGAVDSICTFERDADNGVTLHTEGRYPDVVDDVALLFENGRYKFIGTHADLTGENKAAKEHEIVALIVRAIKGGADKLKDITDSVRNAQAYPSGINAVQSVVKGLTEAGVLLWQKKKYSLAEGYNTLLAIKYSMSS